MSNVRRGKKRPMLDKINKFIGEFTDLKYDGAKIICLVCDRDLMCWDRRDCMKHVNSAQHTNRRDGVNQHTQFMFEFIFMLIACNLPFHLLGYETFRSFWDKYSFMWKLPSQTTLRKYVPSVREEIENRIKFALHNKKLWLCVDEMTDSKKNSVVNVIVRTLDPVTSSFSFLLASKRLEKCTAEAITAVVLQTLEKFQLSRHQLLMFMTNGDGDGATTMRSVGSFLKEECGNFLHVTCKLHALYLVAEQIRICYPNVDGLIAHTRAVFLKSPERIQEFHRQCPDIPEPPQPILTRSGTWLNAAFYYFQHFQKIKSLVLQFDSKQATAIKESQAKFQDAQVEADLQTIYNNYNGIGEAIEKLKNPFLSLVESLQIVDAVYTQLHVLSDAKNNSVTAKWDSLLKKDSDFTALGQICSDSASTHPLSNFRDYFNYANITSLDVERSFSLYKNIFSSQRTKLAETSVETHLMLQIFSRWHPGLLYK